MNFERKLSFLLVLLVCTAATSFCQPSEPIFQYPTGGKIIAPPVFSSYSTIYAVSEDRYLYCLGIDGTLKWRFFLKDRIGQALMVGQDQTVYAATKDGILFAVNTAGREIFSISLSAPVLYGFCSDQSGRIYALLEKGTMVSVSHTGRIRWRITLPSIASGTPVFNGYDIVIPLSDSRLIAVSPWGEKIWEVDLNGPAESICADSAGTVYAGTRKGSVYSVDRYGVVLKEANFGSPVESILLGDNESFLLFSDGTIAMVNGSGKTEWKRNPGMPAAWHRIGAGKVELYAADGRYVIYGLNGMELERGSLDKKELRINGSGGLVIAGSGDWNIYGWTRGGDAAGRWPQPGHDEGMSSAVKAPGSSVGEPPVTGEYLYIKVQAEQDEPAMKQIAINGIRDIIESGDISGKEQYLTDILVTLATEAAFRPRYFMDKQINDLPQIRLQAISLLSRICSIETGTVLRELLRREWDTAVIAAIIEALGSIGSDIGGDSVRAIGEALKKREVRADPDAVLAAVTALDNIRRYHGFLPDPSGIEILFSIVKGDYSKGIRKYALDVIKNMGK